MRALNRLVDNLLQQKQKKYPLVWVHIFLPDKPEWRAKEQQPPDMKILLNTYLKIMRNKSKQRWIINERILDEGKFIRRTVPFAR